jgi:hypothetical protein
MSENDTAGSGRAARATRGGEADAPEQPDTRADVDPEVAQLLGLRPADADPIPTADELDGDGAITDTRIYEGELEARAPGGDQPGEDPAANLVPIVAAQLRDGETDDAREAAEEGLTWVPPTDPPTVADARGDAEIAAGFSTSAGDEPFDADHHASALSPHDEVEARDLDALRADAQTAGLADGLRIDAEGGRITIAGAVDDLTDEEAVLAVAESVDGVTEAVSRLETRALERTQPAPAGPTRGGTER